MLENITRREQLKGTDPPATDASRHTLTISPEIVCSLVGCATKSWGILCYLTYIFIIIGGQAAKLRSHISVSTFSYYWVCAPGPGAPTFVISHISYYYFCPPKTRSIFGLHRKPWCQKFRLGLHWVACIRIYVPLHSLGPYNVFVA